MEDEALEFFNEMFDTIPGPFKLINPDYIQDEEMEDANAKNKKKPTQKKLKGQNLSMIEIKERAQQKMETIQKVNREKSMAKIKELTE